MFKIIHCRAVLSAILTLTMMFSVPYCAFGAEAMTNTNTEPIILTSDLSLKSVTADGGGDERQMSEYISTQRWSRVTKSYIYEDGNGTFSVLDASDGINIDTYNVDTMKHAYSTSVDMESDIFGGFYCGEEYNYIVFGQNNEEMSADVVTFKTVKYSKDWTKLGETDYSDNNTVYPFDAGTVRMTEYNGHLYVRSSHEMYSGHQANITYSINTDTMELADSFSDTMNIRYGYVSHSFNQFIKVDNGKLIGVDHGDAYPRAVVLGEYTSALENGKFIASGRYNSTMMLEIPGDIGANCTGVTVGGFEVSDNNYIVAINTIDHSKVTSYTSFTMEGLDKDERDVVLLIKSKNSDEVRQVYLTDYVDNGKLASTPYITKLADNSFMVLWEEFKYSGSSAKSNGVKYVRVDENGNMLTEIQSGNDAHLSYDCQPTAVGDSIIWYINNGTKRDFYILSGADTDVTPSEPTETPIPTESEAPTPTAPPNSGDAEIGYNDISIYGASASYDAEREEHKVTVSLLNSSDTMVEVDVYFAVFDDNDVLIGAEKKTVTVAADTLIDTPEIVVNGTYDIFYYYRLFAFDSKTGINPLCDFVEF